MEQWVNELKLSRHSSRRPGTLLRALSFLEPGARCGSILAPDLSCTDAGATESPRGSVCSGGRSRAAFCRQPVQEVPQPGVPQVRQCPFKRECLTEEHPSHSARLGLSAPVSGGKGAGGRQATCRARSAYKGLDRSVPHPQQLFHLLLGSSAWPTRSTTPASPPWTV